MKRVLLAAVLVLLAALAACGDSVPVSAVQTYQPVAAGENGLCYYVDSPAEVAALVAAGLCQPAWVAAPMPLVWHERYALWLDSDDYGTRFIPVSRRVYYRQTVVVSFERTYRVQIQQQSASASYRGANGQTVSGAQVQRYVASGKASFSGGQRAPGAGSHAQPGSVSRATAATAAPTRWVKSQSSSFSGGQRSGNPYQGALPGSSGRRT